MGIKRELEPDVALQPAGKKRKKVITIGQPLTMLTGAMHELTPTCGSTQVKALAAAAKEAIAEVGMGPSAPP